MKTEINREKVISFFREYTERYNINDSRVRLKIEHTYKVAEISERIASSLGMDKNYVNLAWLSGMLHDIGRFEQLKRYDTFLDPASTDHAKLGADILFKDMLINDFTDSLEKEDLYILETAIRLHNRLSVPDEFKDKSRVFIDMLRDADKADIFRVMATIPYEERGGRAEKTDDPHADEKLMEYVKAHKCIPYAPGRNRFESYIAHCCMAFELVYDETVVIVKEQGYLDTLLGGVGDFENLPKDGRGRKQMDYLKGELSEYYGNRERKKIF